MGQHLVNNIYLYDGTGDEIGTMLKSLKTGAAGYDEINASLLKLISLCITEPRVYLNSKSLREGAFPSKLNSELKTAYVIQKTFIQ